MFLLFTLGIVLIGVLATLFFLHGLDCMIMALSLAGATVAAIGMVVFVFSQIQDGIAANKGDWIWQAWVSVDNEIPPDVKNRLDEQAKSKAHSR